MIAVLKQVGRGRRTSRRECRCVASAIARRTSAAAQHRPATCSIMSGLRLRAPMRWPMWVSFVAASRMNVRSLASRCRCPTGSPSAHSRSLSPAPVGAGEPAAGHDENVVTAPLRGEVRVRPLHWPMSASPNAAFALSVGDTTSRDCAWPQERALLPEFESGVKAPPPLTARSTAFPDARQHRVRVDSPGCPSRRLDMANQARSDAGTAAVGRKSWPAR